MYFMFVDPMKAMVDVLHSYDIYTSETSGNTGHLIHVSNQDLENTFGKDMKLHDILSTILSEGTIVPYIKGSRCMRSQSATITQGHAVHA